MATEIESEAGFYIDLGSFYEVTAGHEIESEVVFSDEIGSLILGQGGSQDRETG